MIKYRNLLISYLFLTIPLPNNLVASDVNTFMIKAPRVVLSDIPFNLHIKIQPPLYSKIIGQKVFIKISEYQTGKVAFSDSIFIASQSYQEITLEDLKISQIGKKHYIIEVANYHQGITIHSVPSYLSIMPPLFAILLALIFRQVIIALFCGIWLGVTFFYDYNPFLSFLHTLDEYIIKAITDPERISILIFSLVLGGMVGVITRSGGTKGIVQKLSIYAKNPRRGQLAIWAMGIFIFFDDYANTLIVGNTMRPLTDKLRISREKLSYLVDSTAAPVANIAIISTWIGYEISLISQSFKNLGISQNVYITFFKTIPYNFYPIYALFFGFLIAYLLRDFGSMYHAERRARQTGKVLSEAAVPLSDLSTTEIESTKNIPQRWYNAFIPILVVIISVLWGLVYTGYNNLLENGVSFENKSLIQQISIIIGNSDSFAVLMWASFLGSISAIVLSVSQRLLSLHQAMEAWVMGIKSMVMAALILTSAWTLGIICQELYTADYIIHITKAFLTPHWLPILTFLTAAVISFATGTSWGTMAILMPIAIPLAFKFPLEKVPTATDHITVLILSTTAAVLAGATFGDHCSPISDTTIMSSMASGADHIDHVRTQLPYAITVGIVASLFGYIPIGLEITGWWVLFIGFFFIFLIIRWIGKKTD